MAVKMRMSIRAAALAAATLLGTTAAHAALVISTQPTQNVACSGGVCAATAEKAVLNVTDLANLIATSPLTVQSGSLAQDIAVDAPFSWTSPNALTLDANRSLIINRALVDSGTAALTLSNGKKGELRFGPTGNIAFLGTSNSLTINGESYTLIDSIASLASAVTANPAGAYALANNYDASVDGQYRLSPIYTAFTGSFEGLGNTISHFSLHTHRKFTLEGLFLAIGTFANQHGNIADLRLTDVHVTASRTAGGAAILAGVNWGAISGVDVQGDLRGDCNCTFAGLVSVNEGLVSNSFANVNIVAKTSYGDGLVQDNVSTIVNSHSAGTITADSGGGLVGGNEGTISRSFSTVSWDSGTGFVGGLVGRDQPGGEVIDSYAMGAVQGVVAGGLIGFSHGGQFSTSYSIGQVNGAPSGGFIGEDQNPGSSFSGNYWDTKTSGTDQGTGDGNVPGITGLTSEQLKSGLPAGFDPKIWAQNSKINKGFPYLIDNPPVK